PIDALALLASDDLDARSVSLLASRFDGRPHRTLLRQRRAGASTARVERPPTTVVLAAAALRRGGNVHGLVHELWVERVGGSQTRASFDREDVLGAVQDDFRASAVNVFFGVRAYAEEHFPERLARAGGARLALKVTKEDEPSSGDSAELPIAIAFFAALLGLEVPRDAAATGAVVCEARRVLTIGPVGDVEAKLLAAHDRGLRRLLLPGANAADVDRAERVPRALARERARFVSSFEDVIEELFPDLD
ncbi:MAG TPA: S16 family serine protease, partial [Minicystis sp.]|nr:S16 family serine protease [Minicystis sp.]